LEIFIGLIISLFGHGMASGPVTWIYFADILPDIGVSLVLTNIWIWTTIQAYLLPEIKEWSDEDVTFKWIFMASAVSTVIGFFFVVFAVKETKGLSLRKVWKLYNPK
jgi:hypothetical protein